MRLVRSGRPTPARAGDVVAVLSRFWGSNGVVLERSIQELSNEPAHPDRLSHSRRDALRTFGLSLFGGFLKTRIPFAVRAPLGLTPISAWAAAPGTVLIDKPGLTVLSDRPINAETPAHLLDDPITPTSRLFVRNNGTPPEVADATWRIRVGGEACLNPRQFSIADLKREFTPVTYQLQLECGGNGRAEFRPQVSGNQWTTGAIGCPRWTGVRLRDVLDACGIRDDAVYVAYRAADRHLSGDPDREVISRGVPVAKAIEAESLLAFAMNGEPLTPIHGGPLRMVCGGWPGSVSGKWVTEILIREREHDGAKMGGSSYRVPCRPVAPGGKPSALCIIESMPVKSLITYPQHEAAVARGRPFVVRGHAWAGDRAVANVAVSIDFGATWQATELKAPVNRLAWQQWQTSVRLPRSGYYEVWARATDSAGVSQPMVLPGWNPKGYLNNAAHRIAVRAS